MCNILDFILPYITQRHLLNLVEMGIGPPEALGDVVDGEPVRPEDAVFDHLYHAFTIHVQPTNEGPKLPVSPEEVPKNDNFDICITK